MEKKDRTVQVVFANITIGMQLAIIILLFVYGGYRLDLHFNKSPLFVGIGTVLGMVIGFYHLFKELDSMAKREKEAKKKGKQVRKKWNW
ncbi:MAG: AtpZ/AtpI family protein [Spirochaetota bacterium]